MDLRERVDGSSQRHPWELARMHAIQSIIESLTGGKYMVRVLDVGCGDGFVSRALSRRADVQLVDSVDIHLTDRQVDALQMEDKKVVYHNNYSELPDRRYDLVLLLDVLEHVREDGNFLARDCGQVPVHCGLPDCYSTRLPVPLFPSRRISCSLSKIYQEAACPAGKGFEPVLHTVRLSFPVTATDSHHRGSPGADN